MENTKPNLFDYATSELSQDAFFCWLLSWLNDRSSKNKKLKDVAFDLLQLLTNKTLKKESVLGQIEVHRQFKNVDIVVELKASNEILLIEDKIHGKDNVKKQKSYINAISEHKNIFYSREQIMTAYIKTGIIDSRDLHLKGLKNSSIVFLEDIYKVLSNREIKNDIFNDFKEHIAKKVERRHLAKKRLFERNEYSALKKHIGQSIFVEHLKKDNRLLNIKGEDCYTKVEKSKGGQPWIELWITSHGSENWEFEDAIFYRIEAITRQGEKVPSLTLRQYNNQINKLDEKEVANKIVRYKKLKSRFSDLASNLPYLKDTKHTSPRYYSSVFGTFIFDNSEIELDQFCTSFAKFHSKFLNDLKNILPRREIHKF